MFGTRIIGFLIYDILNKMKNDIFSPFGLLIDLSCLNLNFNIIKFNLQILSLFLKYFTNDHLKNIQEIYLLNGTQQTIQSINSFLKFTFKLTNFIKRYI
jgi:hypothetical protein